MYFGKMRFLSVSKMGFLSASIVLLTTTGVAMGQSQPEPPDAALVAKGLKLFNDASVSGSGTFSCASCHFSTGHTNNKTYVGLDVVADGDPDGRSTPTLWGAGSRSAYGWGGTSQTLEDGIRTIIVNRMKGKEPAKETLAALSAYVRSLPVPKNWQLLDDGTPLSTATAEVKRGFDLFLGKAGCGACHILPNLDRTDHEDVGTGGEFKVPSLRAVASTAPYFHDGRTASLRDAVKYMWEVYAKRTNSSHLPTDAELDDLVAYVSAL